MKRLMILAGLVLGLLILPISNAFTPQVPALAQAQQERVGGQRSVTYSTFEDLMAAPLGVLETSDWRTRLDVKPDIRSKKAAIIKPKEKVVKKEPPKALDKTVKKAGSTVRSKTYLSFDEMIKAPLGDVVGAKAKVKAIKPDTKKPAKKVVKRAPPLGVEVTYFGYKLPKGSKVYRSFDEMVKAPLGKTVK